MEIDIFVSVDDQEHEDKSRMGESTELVDSRGADKWNDLDIFIRLKELEEGRGMEK